jgi:acyl transferase domain-containing protein
MADGFGVVMAEMEFAGLKFKGGKIFVVLTALGTLMGGAWGAFEFYKDYLNMKETISAYVAPDLSGFDKRIDLVQQEVEMMQSEMSMILEEVGLVADVAKELEDAMKELQESIDKQIKLTLENPLNQMKQ